MTSTAEQLRSRAKKKLARLKRVRRDARYRAAMGRFVAAKLITSNDPSIVADREPVPLADVLWAGRFEPRLLELLPAVVIKRPSLLVLPAQLPADLNEVVSALRGGLPCPDFRGLPAAQCARWVARVGRKGLPTKLKSFRLRHEDLERLRRLAEELSLTSETEVIRLALRALERSAAGIDRERG